MKSVMLHPDQVRTCRFDRSSKMGDKEILATAIPIFINYVPKNILSIECYKTPYKY